MTVRWYAERPNITASRQRIVELMLDPADAEPLPETLEAIESRRPDHRWSGFAFYQSYYQPAGERGFRGAGFFEGGAGVTSAT